MLEPGWKSQWRRDLDEWRQLQRRAPKPASRPESRPAPSAKPPRTSHAAATTAKPPGERCGCGRRMLKAGATACSRCSKKPKPPALPVRHCLCGEVVRKPDAAQCWRCRAQAQKKPAPAERHCALCAKRLGSGNRSGLCKHHLNLRLRRVRVLRDCGARPLCQFQAAGMRCGERLYRDNRIGLCCFHRPRPTARRFDGNRQPKMVPLE